MTTTVTTVTNKSATPLWQNLWGIIDRPAQTFQSILVYPGWWRWGLPLIIFYLAFATATAVQIPYLQTEARLQAESQLADLPASQAEAARATLDFTLSVPFLAATGLGFGGIILLMGMLAQTIYFYFAAMLAGGADMNFGRMFTVTTWSRLPLAIGFGVQATFVLISDGLLRYPGLAAMVATGDQLADAKNPLLALLARVDLFWLWHLLLAVIGVAIAAKFGRGKSLALVIIYALLALGMAVAPSLLAMAMA
jgi:hypothetical protein